MLQYPGWGILHGGAWNNPEESLHCAFREFFRADDRGEDIGLRVVCTDNKEETDMKNKIEYVTVEPGKFMMGFQENAVEVAIRNSFQISKHVITNEQYAEFLDDIKSHGAYYPDPLYWNDPRFNKPQQPVVGINFYQALGFCAWAGCRLPTSEEWEYAARGPESFIYPWGNNSPTPKLAHYNQDWHTGCPSEVRVLRDGQWVDLFEKGKSWCGAYQMSGNVWELCGSPY